MNTELQTVTRVVGERCSHFRRIQRKTLSNRARNVNGPLKSHKNVDFFFIYSAVLSNGIINLQKGFNTMVN